MKISLAIATMSVLFLTGCGSMMPRGQCTNLIGMNGSLLKICQTPSDLTIYEDGIDPEATNSISVVNSPEALKSLQRELPLRQDLKMSRKFVARSCSISGTRYVNVSLTDLKRIMRASQPTVAAYAEATQP